MTGASEARARLEEGVRQLAVPADCDRLMAFLGLLEKWNRTFNLTAIRDLTTAVDLHLLDSLSLWPYLHGKLILDVGTGAGLPGIPLAIVAEKCRFVLLDSRAKRTRFVQQAVIELGLRNVEVVTARVEHYQPNTAFDTLLARAYASLGEIWSGCSRLLAPNGHILAQKGRLPEQEIRALTQCAIRVHRLHIPGLRAERHLIELKAQPIAQT